MTELLVVTIEVMVLNETGHGDSTAWEHSMLQDETSGNTNV